MSYASTRRRLIQRLWSLAVVPYLFLALFGEGLHSHPLFSQAPQSTAGISASQTAAHFEGESPSHSHRATTALECAACVWAAQSSAHISAATPAPLLSPQVAFFAASPRSPLSACALLSRSRGPPLN